MANVSFIYCINTNKHKTHYLHSHIIATDDLGCSLHSHHIMVAMSSLYLFFEGEGFNSRVNEISFLTRFVFHYVYYSVNIVSNKNVSLFSAKLFTFTEKIILFKKHSMANIVNL